MTCISISALANAFLGMGLITFVWFWLDKIFARSESPRIPEATLILLSMSFGWIGALVAMKMHRHKTKKTSFHLKLALAIMVNIILIVWLLFKVSCDITLHSLF